MTQNDLAQQLQAGLQHHRSGRFGQAESIYRQILQIDPSHAGALHYLGLLAATANRLDAAEELIRRAIAIKPDAADPYVNLGNILAQGGKFDEAIEMYRKGLALKPNSAEGHNNLGNALRAKGRFDESMKCFERALELNPKYPAAHMNLGNTLRMMERFDQAVASYKAALALDANYVDAYSNLGCVLQDLGKYEEAIGELKKAITIRPEYVKAYASVGIALTDMGLVEEAIGAYEEAVRRWPENAEVHSNLLLTLHYSPTVSEEKIWEEHRLWGQKHAEPLRKFAKPHANDRSADRRLRVGYISADFRGHPVSAFFEPILESHNREEFEVVCYSDVVMADATTERLRGRADLWREIVQRPHEAVAEMIREDGVVVLVDLSGHTDSNRLLAPARRPAPVQVTYLGYPNSTGMTAMDYRVTDAIADPVGESDSWCSEELVRLPRCAWCYRPVEGCPEVGELPAARNGYVTFGSFNVLPKINGEVLEVWAEILKAVPGSRLLIKNKGMAYGPTVRRMKKMFAELGVAEGRVEFRGTDLSQREHLQRYGEIDIALDPFPYNGTTTTCEALWMGVPVVTLVGKRHAARVGGSLLNCVGMNELVASTKGEYVEIATKLARGVEKAGEMRRDLRERIRMSPLMDGVGFTRELERAYRGMWRTWCESGGVS